MGLEIFLTSSVTSSQRQREGWCIEGFIVMTCWHKHLHSVSKEYGPELLINYSAKKDMTHSIALRMKISLYIATIFECVCNSIF